MRKIVTLAVAIAAPLLLTVPLAHADPSSGYSENCSQAIAVAPNIWATTCTHMTWYNYGANHEYYGKVIINNATGAPVTVRADLLYGTAVIPGDYITAPAAGVTEAYSPTVQDPTSNVRGRGYVAASGWSTSTYAP